MYITYYVGTQIIALTPPTGWSTRSLDNTKLIKSLCSYNQENEGNAEELAERLINLLTSAMDDAAHRKTPKTNKRRSVQWWSPQLKELRTESNHLKRVYQWKRKRHGSQNSEAEHRAAKKVKLLLVKAIKNAKEQAWAELCALIDKDPWGKPYRLVMGRLVAQQPIPGINTPGRIEKLSTLFFQHTALEQ